MTHGRCGLRAERTRAESPTPRSPPRGTGSTGRAARAGYALARACAQTHSLRHAEPLGHLFGCEKGRHRRLSPFKPSAEVSVARAQATLGEPSHLAVPGVVVAIFDEGPGAVALFGLWRRRVSTRRTSSVSARRSCSSSAGVGEPASRSSLRRVVGRRPGSAVSLQRGGSPLRRVTGVDRERGLSACRSWATRRAIGSRGAGRSARTRRARFRDRGRRRGGWSRGRGSARCSRARVRPGPARTNARSTVRPCATWTVIA